MYKDISFERVLVQWQLLYFLFIFFSESVQITPPESACVSINGLNVSCIYSTCTFEMYVHACG